MFCNSSSADDISGEVTVATRSIMVHFPASSRIYFIDLLLPQTLCRDGIATKDRPLCWGCNQSRAQSSSMRLRWSTCRCFPYFPCNLKPFQTAKRLRLAEMQCINWLNSWNMKWFKVFWTFTHALHALHALHAQSLQDKLISAGAAPATIQQWWSVRTQNHVRLRHLRWKRLN